MVESWSRSEEIQQSQDHDTLESFAVAHHDTLESMGGGTGDPQQSQDAHHDTLEFGGGSLGTVGFNFPNGNSDTQLELDDDTQLDLDTDHRFAGRLGPEAGTQDLDQEDEAEYTSKSMGFDVRLRGGEGSRL